MGNIASVTQNGKLTSYTYDKLGQLTRVNDQNDTTSGSSGTTWVYTYDRGGNILSKTRYAYTTGTLGAALQTIPYEYDTTWKDKLVKYNGVSISYDAIGNPLSDGTWTYTWEKGRQLKQMTKSGTTATFAYNADGLRIRKTVGSTVTNYTLHGKNIVHMTQGSNALHFWYDASNKPAIVQFNGTKYAYLHNLQGDIVGIVDSAGNEVVKYIYDPWGKILSTSGSLASTLGTIQPFRYRGYVYDEETDLYYLRSRYYNTQQCRFVNADRLYSGNLYAYCNNMPITGVDEDGFAVVCCIDENGAETSFMTQVMMGGGGGGGGGSAIMTISYMTEEERKEALVAAVIVGLSMVGSAGIMYGAHTLGTAFLAEATLVKSASNTAIGYFLYGATVANGVWLSYVWDDMVHGFFGKDTEPRTEADYVKDLVKEFIPVDVPVPLEFIINYVQEIEE